MLLRISEITSANLKEDMNGKHHWAQVLLVAQQIVEIGYKVQANSGMELANQVIKQRDEKALT